MSDQISIEEYLKIKDVLEEYQVKSFKYDLIINKIDKKLNKSERKLQNTNSELKKIILEAKISFLKELKSINEEGQVI